MFRGLFFTQVLGALAGALVALNANAAPNVDFKHAAVVEGRVVAPLKDGPGTVRTSLDPKWQRVAERVLTESRAPEGAIVVSDVRTGKILAWVSRGSGHDYVSTPFAPSASLFKVATAAALLETGRANASTRQCYSGGEHDIRPADLLSSKGGPTCATLSEGVGKSLNLVLARLAMKHLAKNDLQKNALALGFGGEVPIDIAVSKNELLIPDDSVGMARTAAGFGPGKLSPLGALTMMQTIANGGERIRLSALADSPARISAGRAVSERTAHELRQMLETTVTRGTCAKVFRRPDGKRYLPNTSVAAKTGTLITGHPTRMFSWFAGFAPSNKPEIAISVMLGNDVTWWAKANAVGRNFLRAYFDGERSRSPVARRN